MYKEIWISLIIVILIIVLNTFFEKYIDKKLNYITQKLSEIEKKLEVENNEDLIMILKDVDEYWRKNKTFLSCYIEHDELEKVETEFTSLKAYLEDDKLNSREYLKRMEFVIKHIEKKDDFIIENIL